MDDLMTAARFYRPNAPFVIEKIPIPPLQPHEILVQVKACGICGSDVHIYEGRLATKNPPIVLGHEVSGVIARLGGESKQLKEGEAVCIDSFVSCKNCKYCLGGRRALCHRFKIMGIFFDGGFAEYVKVAADNVIKLGKKVDFEQGIMVADVAPTALHAIRRSNLSFGDSLAVVGVGAIGLQVVQIAKHFGIFPIIAIDIRQELLKKSLDLGADAIINSIVKDPVKEVKEKFGGSDVVIECVGIQETIKQAVQILKKGGRAVIVGVGADSYTIPALTAGEYEVVGSFGFTREEINNVNLMVENGFLEFSSSISHRFPLKNINEAFEVFKNKVGNPIKVIINPT